MNYILKLQSSGGWLGLLINNTRARDTRSYVCGHCLRNHLIINDNGKSLSTYVSALKLILKRKEILKKTEVNNNNNNNNINNSYQKVLFKSLQKKKKISNRFTELVKVTKNKSKETKMTIQQLKASEVASFAAEPGMTFEIPYNKNKYNFDSTRSYDPNIIVPIDFIEILHGVNSISPANKSKNSESPVQKGTIKSHLTVKPITKKNLTKKQTGTVKLNNYSNLKTQPLLESKNYKLKKTNVKEVKRKNGEKKNTSSSTLKILPMSTVEIFPMPKRLQQNISKKSERAIKELPKPGLSTLSNLTTLQGRKNVNILLETEEENKLDVEEIDKVEEKVSHLTAENFDSFNVEVSSKYYTFKELIKSYIDVAVNNQMEEDSFKFLSSWRSKPEWKKTLENNFVDVYNILLHCYSSKGDWMTTSEIVAWIKEDNIKFNSQTYAGILECLGRVNRNEFENENLWREEVIKWLKNLYADKLKLNDLFVKTTLTKDKRDKVLDVIRKILPHFEIESIITKLNSNCHLLKDLYQGPNLLQSPLESNFMIETIENLVDEQLLLEKNFKVQIESVYKNNASHVTEKDRKKLDNWKNEWRKNIHAGFLWGLETAKSEHEKFPKKMSLYLYLKSLPAEMFVDVMMLEVQSLVEFSGGYSPLTLQLYRKLGEKIYNRYETKKKIDSKVFDKMGKLFKKYCGWYLDPSGPAMNTRQEWQMLIQDFQEGSNLDLKEVPWPNSITSALGKFLYSIILKEVKIGKPESQIPVFYLILRYKNSKSSEEVKCHPTVANLFRKIGFEQLNFDANQIPMVCPPKPWKTVNHGGYLILSTEFIRKPQGPIGKMTDLKKVPYQQLYSVFDSLNALQTVPWIVNEGVLDVVLEVFRNGGPEKLEVPKLPDTDPIPIHITPEMSMAERVKEYQRRQKIQNERQNEYGLWCEALYKLSLANHFRKRVFWFPQNFDFRGRVYPVPPHLNHLGSDLFRSLLMFAKGKPLGPKGLDWIKIHTINLTGTHKNKSVQERLQYANDILPDILDSAERPLTGKKWWMESDEPWQTLAACLEIKNILSSPNPELYTSKFPIHQDGSCNGLQHYAALGRDTIGAKSVNLAPSDIPQDVYSVITKIIEEKRHKDAADGVEIARILEGFIKRKVVKQTIMTTVYGVTRYGARLQIARQLEDIDKFPQKHVWTAAGYLTSKTFESLKQMFTSAKAIQDWFIQCAIVICGKKDYVQWLSPLGLPILQPYAKMKRENRKEKSVLVPVTNLMKQKNAFPPNFVHSLDSSHMMLTALFCEQAGVTFASIHDCFWTHPCTVDKMNRICREQFVSLHSQPILEDLSNFFVKCYIKDGDKDDESKALEIFNSVPKTGDFNLDTVLNSIYFFS